MRGKILNCSSADNSGVILSDDGRRFRFARQDFRSEAAPRPGLTVDFVHDGEEAREVYVMAGPVLGGEDGTNSNAMITAILAIVCAVLGFLIPGLGLLLAVAALLLGLRARKLARNDANRNASVLALVAVIGGCISMISSPS